jgi:hypothetical protein
MLQVYRPSADMGGLAALDNAGTHVAADGALEDLHHEREQRARESGIPAAFGRLVPDEGMLRLHLEELGTSVRSRSRPGTVRRQTETGMFESSSVLRMRSRPARGTCVSCWRPSTTVLRRHAAQALACLPKIICSHGQAPLKHTHGEKHTTSSPLLFRSPSRTRASESSPAPSVALCTSVAKKQTDESTRRSNAARNACGGVRVSGRRVRRGRGARGGRRGTSRSLGRGVSGARGGG